MIEFTISFAIILQIPDIQQNSIMVMSCMYLHTTYLHYVLLKNVEDRKMPSRKHRKYAKYKKMSKSLPQPFQLPENFPESVKGEISAGHLTASGRKRFMLTVANAVFEHTQYPSNLEYDHVAKQIVTKYMFMGDKEGSHVSN